MSQNPQHKPQGVLEVVGNLEGVEIPMLKQITQNLQEGLFILDASGNLLFLNSEGERMLGWKMDELLGKNMHNNIHYQNPHGENIAATDCPVHKCILSGQVYRAPEEAFIHRDGHIIPVSFTATPIMNNGRISYSVTTFQDLIRRKQAEREIKQARDIALETSRLRSEFLANMSHEIRTPINGVIGMTCLLLDTKLQKDQKEMANTAKESAQALLTVVNDILDFSRLEGGKLDLQTVDFRPEKLIGEVAGLLGSHAQNKGLTLEHLTSDKIPSTLRGDPARLRQVLLNLTGNAVKFTKKGKIFINAQLAKKTKSRVVVRFSVTDSGIGIPKAARHRLFQPFTQVDGSTKRSFGGTGLGLSIASRLVELMGGEIGFTSKKGKGSTFWFTVPLSKTSQLSMDSSQPPLPNDMLKGIKALVVDPHQISQTITLNHLLEWKMQGTAVESAEEAIAFLRHETDTGHPCDLVLISSTNLDLSIDLARTISHDAKLLPTSLVLLTRTREKKRLEEAKRAGFVTHLNRPVSGPRLQQCLLSLFNVSRTEPNKTNTQGLPQTQTGELTDQRLESGKSVLLAEDNTIIQKMVQMQLNRLGYAVRIVANGKEALHAASSACSLILMDCKMPLMDGFQAASAIRAKEPKDRRIPIIAMTAGTQHGEESQIKNAGMDDFLNKPIQIENLSAMLEKWMPKPEPSRTRKVRPPEEPAIDLVGMGNHFGNDNTNVQEFLTLYNSSCSTLLSKMQKNLEKKNLQTLMENCQELRGSSSTVGAIHMAQLCEYLEAEKDSSDWTTINNIFAEMEEEMEHIKVFTEKMLNNQSSTK